MNQPLDTKAKMYAALLGGRLGNHAMAWDSLEALAASPYRGHVSLRAKDVANPVRLYHLKFDDVPGAVAGLPEAQHAAELVFSESPPDAERTLQGEVMRGVGGRLALTYSYYPAPMRLAFEKETLHAFGLVADLLLRAHLDPCDRDWLMTLLDDYPGHVIEFSGFRVPVGVLRRRMLVWEVRLY